jgi:hypothetical protein
LNGDRPGAAGAAQPGDVGAGTHVDSGFGERGGDHLADERLHPGQEALAARQQGDRGAQAVPGAGHLHADTAGADDGQPCGHVMGVGGRAVGPRARLGDARQVGDGRSAAGADGDGVPGREL